MGRKIWFILHLCDPLWYVFQLKKGNMESTVLSSISMCVRTRFKCKVVDASHLSNSKPSSLSPKTLTQRPSSPFLVLLLSQLLRGVIFDPAIAQAWTQTLQSLNPKTLSWYTFTSLGSSFGYVKIIPSASGFQISVFGCIHWSSLFYLLHRLLLHPLKGRYLLRFSPTALFSIHSTSILFVRNCSSC